ncbi:MAG: complex I subunit 5 family protein [Caldicoprobacterales bacterium]|jgi:multicomponent Na+:H+ antiporter subunit D
MTAGLKTNLPVFIVVIPMFVAFMLPTFARRIKWIEGTVAAVKLLGLAAAAWLAHMVLYEKDFPVKYIMGGWPAPWGIELVIGNLAALFILTIAIVSLPVALFARDNLEKEVGPKQRIARFYVLYLLLIGALAGMAITNDLFNVFVLVEVVTLSCCGLVSSRKGHGAAKAAFNYLILATLGSALVLGGIGFIYILTGHLNMEFASAELGRVWQSSPHTVWMALSFLFVGFGVKAALFPLHVWLPDAHSMAPSPASALLSGLAIKGYIISFMKILYVIFGHTLMQEYGIYRILILIGMVAIIIGSLSALLQKRLKRRLAFSTVAQVGYLFLGLGLANKEGLMGTLLYLVSHAVIKSLLFLAAGAVISATGKENIRDLAGVGRKMPIAMGTFTIASLSLIGLPLLSGFIGKWHLVLGSLGAGDILSVAVIIIGSILCAAYLLPIIRIAYFEPAPEADWQDPGLPQKAALILLAAGVVLLGVLPGPFIELAGRAAAELLLIQ